MMFNNNKGGVIVKRGDPVHAIFVYATLMNPRSRSRVLKHRSTVTPGVLTGYTRMMYRTPEGKHFDSFERTGDNNDRIIGDVILVDAGDLEKLIKWEDQYDLIWVQLQDGRHCKAFKLKKEDELNKGIKDE